MLSSSMKRSAAWTQGGKNDKTLDANTIITYKFEFKKNAEEKNVNKMNEKIESKTWWKDSGKNGWKTLTSKYFVWASEKNESKKWAGKVAKNEQENVLNIEIKNVSKKSSNENFELKH